MKSSLNILWYFLIVLFTKSSADVAHFFAPEFGGGGGFFQQHYHQHPHQQHFQLQPPSAAPLPSLYGAPAEPPGYPHPAAPTPSPVAPTTTSTTTEFSLPEIVENRNAKHRTHFIPLSNHYLPPSPPAPPSSSEDRPNYESPQLPPNQGYLPPEFSNSAPLITLQQPQQNFFGYSDGYYYPRPTQPTTSTTTTRRTTTTTRRPTTTTARPLPIIVQDPIELLPPINFVEPAQNPPASQGYDYNAPSQSSPVTRPPPSTPAPAYLPAAQDFSSNSLLQLETNEAGRNAALRLHLHEMRCLHSAGGYFRSILKVDSFIGATPAVDNDAADKRCALRLERSYVVVDVAAEDFEHCGVHACGNDLCLRLRFPAIRGMRTDADAIVTLHCKTQERVAVKTHALKMGVANDVQQRTIGTYAHGGVQNAFRTHVELLRKSSNGFTRHLATNGAVQLGEELLLRAHVLTGDGWNYTKLTDVSLQRISPAGEVLNTAQLLTAHGCNNPSMHAICAQPPTFDAPLGHKLAFKAVMFQGMRSGDELVLSMRITGCLEREDCALNLAQECSATSVTQKRRKRSHVNATLGAGDDDSKKNDNEVSEISRIAFRVVMPTELGDNAEDAVVVEENKEFDMGVKLFKQRNIILYGSVGFVVLMCGLGIFAALKFRKY